MARDAEVDKAREVKAMAAVGRRAIRGTTRLAKTGRTAVANLRLACLNNSIEEGIII